MDLHILSNDISFSVDTTEKGHLTVDENVANFSNILEAISLDHAPVLKKMQRTTKLAFFDQELQCLKREKRKLERKLKKHRQIFLQEWTDFMKNYRDKIATKKQAFISAKLESARSNDVKEKFRCLSNLLSGKARKTLPTHTCDYRLANDFQYYFIIRINNIVN